jgi:hypothetical protein
MKLELDRNLGGRGGNLRLFPLRVIKVGLVLHSANAGRSRCGHCKADLSKSVAIAGECLTFFLRGSWMPNLSWRRRWRNP